MKDRRIAYGAQCSWWDSIDKVAQTASGLPCCPECNGVLMEVASERRWWTGVDHHEASGAANYRAFVEWMRGKCRRNLEVARAEFDALPKST